jgi:predicted AAA+ superfamily ATPase
VVAELTKIFANDAEAPQFHFWRDSHGAEVDVVLDFGGVRIPIEIKSGETPGRSYCRGLRVFRDLAAASGQQISEPYGILVYSGAESGARWGHMLRPWWACS